MGRNSGRCGPRRRRCAAFAPAHRSDLADEAGVDLWEAAGWLGMTVEQLEANYGHHHPDFQEEAAEAFSSGR
jgi:hypothetical protein